jgi:hypothetical protein
VEKIDKNTTIWYGDFSFSEGGEKHAIRPQIQKFPVTFPVLREFGGLHSGPA